MDTNSYTLRKETTLESSIDVVTNSALKWLLKAQAGRDDATWSNDRLSYVANRVAISITTDKNWLNDINKISQIITETTSEKGRATLLNEVGITGRGGKNFYSMTLYMLSLLTLHLASKGHISLKYGHKIHLPPNPAQFLNFFERGLVSDVISHLYAVSTPPRFELCKEFIPKCLKDVMEELGDNIRSSRQRSIMNCMELVTYLNVSKLSSITAEDLTHYFIVNKMAKGSALMYSTFVQMLDRAFGSTLQQEWSKIAESGVCSGNMNVKEDVQATSKIKTFTTKKEVTDMTCDSIDYKDVVIETLTEEVTVLQIGDHHVSVKMSLIDYNPENLTEDSYWKRTQIDYLRQATEKGTKKSKKNRLALLNSYIFDYLPVFFKNNPDTKFKFPQSPSEFLSYIFICRSDTYLLSQFGSDLGSDVDDVFPVSLLDYIYAITEEKAALRGNIKTNSGRDTISEIQRYFDFISAKFSGIPECHLSVNPISNFDKNLRAGYRYNKTNKSKIEMNYWILFRMFIRELSYALVKNAENVVFHNKPNKTKFKINKTLEWLDTKIKIKEVDLSFLGKFAFQDWKAPCYVTNYQTMSSVYLMGWSGLRASNVTWLDIRSYSCMCSNNYDENSFVELFINTDKAQEEPYTSSIAGHVMLLLDRIAKLRLEVDRHGFNEPINYQGEKGSKWGEIRPLLQATKKNGIPIHHTGILLAIVDVFEKCLREHNKQATKEEEFEFETETYYLPKNANSLTFRKIPNYVHAATDYTATIKYTTDGYSLPFTPLNRATKFTPHSLRVTFDSVCSVLADPESVGKISTGQGAETVGYYIKNNREDVAEIKEIQRKQGFMGQFPAAITASRLRTYLPIAAAKDEVIDEQEYLREHALGTAATSYKCVSLSTIKVKGGLPPIEALIKASANQIAFNRTHICPFNNDCPKDVIQALYGEKCCAICPYAIISVKHRVGISAELKRLGDIAFDLTNQVKNGNLLKSEVEKLKDDRDRVIKSISGWLARHRFLSKNTNSGEYFTRKKHDDQLNHISGTIAGHNLIYRLKEVEGISTLESPKLEREARKVTKKVKALLNTSPNSFSIEDDNVSDVSVALEMIRTICNLNEINESDLSTQLCLPTNLEPKWLNAI
ncbi:hypothetical protein [Vibrio hepatarius]|uniref:hypothetical protein n=1 Tax=Vibrio hepatarius TaxID=171383 RepID=UPI00148B605C|nr:hypothetical protein [Vibrio hepatarius]NOI15834.1 hypothetical protein [Vibrio hepatarius]